jgi:hypothetical protein
MPIEAKILYNVRGSVQANYAEGHDEQAMINTRGEQIIVQGLPPLSQIVKAGNSYQASTTSAAAPVVAIPTTAALIGLWNGEPDNGKTYVIDSVFCFTVASTAAQQANTILANISQAQIPTAIANTITPRPLRANMPYRGAARIAVGITLNATDGVAANWFPIGSNGPLIAGATNNIGSCTDIDCKGMFLIPPKGQFSLTVISSAATATSVQVGFRWHELVVPPVI